MTRLSSLSAEEVRLEVQAAERAIRGGAGADPRAWFHCPNGVGATASPTKEHVRAASPAEAAPNATAALAIVGKSTERSSA